MGPNSRERIERLCEIRCLGLCAFSGKQPTNQQPFDQAFLSSGGNSIRVVSGAWQLHLNENNLFTPCLLYRWATRDEGSASKTWIATHLTSHSKSSFPLRTFRPLGISQAKTRRREIAFTSPRSGLATHDTTPLRAKEEAPALTHSFSAACHVAMCLCVSIHMASRQLPSHKLYFSLISTSMSAKSSEQ